MLEFEWDDDNIAHLARHGITPDEVEELFEGPTLRRRGGTDAPDPFGCSGAPQTDVASRWCIKPKQIRWFALHGLGHAPARKADR